ncbi:putative membrane protein [Clostridium botulinum 202F]|nr:putative membrane protein [Clostridium botulinum 202F]MBY6988441.1 hypothetical protein [Clostridium botulinum]
MITVMAWIVLIVNVLSGILNFICTFKDKTVSDRVVSFITAAINLMASYLAYYVLFI